MPELFSVAEVEVLELFSVAEASGWEIEGANSIKPTSRTSAAPLVANKYPPPVDV